MEGAKKYKKAMVEQMLKLTTSGFGLVAAQALFPWLSTL